MININVAPKVSVVMSLYNSRKYLREAIDSVLCQTLSDFEFIIIDDGSKDDSANIVQSYNDARINLISQDNSGLAAALNRGVRLAKGALIARMDPDDICFPERLEKQYEYLHQHPGTMVVGSAARCINENGEELPIISMKMNFDVGELAIPESPCIHPTVMFRRSAFEKAGGYCGEMRYGGEDAVLFNKILSFGVIANLSDVLMYYRLSSSSMSQKSKAFNILLREVVLKKVRGNFIDADQWERLAQEYQNSSSKKRMCSLHFYIAKLFLGTDRDDGCFKARQHLLMALRSSPCSLNIWAYVISSYMPLAWRLSLNSYLKRQINKLK
jgi:glycosyltransferase involved in cell wall biosynthesis